MPQISQRVRDMGQSPIRSLVPYARQAKQEGVKVYHLNIGQPDIETPALALQSLHTYDNKIIEYGASEGSVALRQIARDYYCQEVSRIELDHIFVTTGASEAIAFALYACLDQGGEVIIPEPFYANYCGFAHMSDARIVTVTSDIEDGFDLPAIDRIAAKITSKTRAIILCNPSNPTGSLYSKDDLLAIGRLVKEHDLYLIVDEVYREFCYDEEFFSVLEIPGLEDNVVVIDSISKVFSACGARIGYIVSRNVDLMQSILKTAQLRLCPPNIAQHVAQACYTHRKDYLRGVKAEYRARREYLYHRLSKMDGVRCYLPKAAFYIMAELPIFDAEDFCKWLLSDFRHEGETIMLAPGQGFYVTPEIGRSQVRIAFVLDIPALTKAMDILESAIKTYSALQLKLESVI